uniref:BESS domain-containing protein n=1 Tax=Romanomermis culicivorax TaxID=13658 RepID=A0A915JQF9_ROMCU
MTVASRSDHEDDYESATLVKDQSTKPTFGEQKKTVAAAITRSMMQKEERSKSFSQNKVPTFEDDFQQPEKRLLTIEMPEEIREAQRKDPYILKLLKILKHKQISTISSAFHTEDENVY